MKSNCLRFTTASPIFLIALLQLASVPIAEKSAAGPAQPRKTAIVFAVSGRPDDSQMDAVVVVDGKQLRAPFTEGQTVDKMKDFGEKYFASGREYRLTLGGGEAGRVKVKKWGEGCNSIHAEVSVSTSARLGEHVSALATDSDALGKRAPSRRAPTNAERAAVLTLAKSIYAQHRTPASLISSIKVSNITATDLDGDGKFEFIGSFTSAAKNKFERDLFLIAKPEGATMRADFVKFQAYQPPPEGFLSSIDFFDQLDLDGDAIGEVFAVQGGFDAYAYVIFKKVGGRWRQVFELFGDAC